MRGRSRFVVAEEIEGYDMHIIGEPWPTLTVLAGLPGAGKSYWCERNVDTNALLLSADRLRRRIVSARALFGGMCRDASLALLDGRDVTIDACSLQRIDRAPWLAIAGRCEVRTRLVIIDTPAGLCAARDRARVRAVGRSAVFQRRFQKMICAIPDEGWDEIEFVGTAHNSSSVNKSSRNTPP